MDQQTNPTPAPQPAPNPVPQAAAAPVATVSSGYGGFWRRFLAIFIDGIVLSPVNVAINAILPGGQTTVNSSGFSTSTSNPIATLLIVAATITYFALLESSSWQATLGKKALGMKVTDLNGNRLTKGKAFGREAAKLVSDVTLLIGYIIAAFDSRKQALHDKIAGTLVVKV